MAIEEVGVRLVADQEAQFVSALGGANKAVANFGDTAKEAEKQVAALDKQLESARKTSFNAYAKGLQQGTVTTKDFQSMLIGSADKAGLLSTDLARLTKSSGLFSESQFKAAENMRLAQGKADELAAAVANGSMSAKDAGKEFGAFTAQLGNTQGVLASLITNFGSFIAVGTVVAGAVYKIGMEVKKLADEYMNYAFQVKDFGRIIGATPEEASRLIQVADDVRLSVESMTVAMKSAINKGYRPTVDGLGKMSDAYLSIQDPIQRSRFLTETFGRSGLEMAKMMELGSARIREMGASVQSGLIVTQQGIDQATKYYETLDQLGDSWTALKMSAGPVILRIALEGAEGLNQLFENAMAYSRLLDEMNRQRKEGTVSAFTYSEAQKAVYTGTQGNIVAMMQFLEWLNKQDQAVQDNTKDLSMYSEASGKVNYTLASGMGDVQRYGSAVLQANKAVYQATQAAGNFAGATAGTAREVKKAAVSISDMARKAGDLANIEKIKIGLDFQFPNIADKMKNLIASIKWQEVGGGAMDQFMQGFAAKVAPLTPEQQTAIAKKVGAVDIALEFKAGNIEQNDALTQIRELQGGTWANAQAFLDKVNSVKPADMTKFLEDITGLAKPETTAAAATSTDKLAQSTATLGSSFGTAEPNVSKLKDDIGNLADSEHLEKAVKQTDDLTQKTTGLGTAIGIANPALSGWKDSVGTLSENAQSAAAQVGALNTQIKSLPESKTVTITVVTVGDVPGLAAGGAVTGSTVYMVGEKGPELFVPASGGTIIPANQTQRFINNAYTVIPMAKGGKIGQGGAGAQEKAHNKMVKERNKKKKPVTSSGGGGEEGSETGDIIDNASSSLEALKAREEFTWSALRASVAQYNAMVKAGASPAMLAGLRQQINVRQTEAQAITQLRQEAEMQYNLLRSTQGDTGEGMQQSSIWLQNLMDKFKDFFALLTSSAAKEAMKIINPLVSSSPAPLAQGLSQIREQMSKLSNGGLQRFSSSVAQLAAPNQSSYSRSSTYNISVPVTATVGNQADIKILAYAVAKEIAANVRA